MNHAEARRRKGKANLGGLLTVGCWEDNRRKLTLCGQIVLQQLQQFRTFTLALVRYKYRDGGTNRDLQDERAFQNGVQGPRCYLQERGRKIRDF